MGFRRHTGKPAQGMWSEAALRLATLHSPGHDVSASHFFRQFKRQFPWQRVTHPELNTPELWWEAVHAAYRQAFARLGLDDRAVPLSELRAHILDATRYPLFDDAVPALEQAAQDGWRQIIVSNHVPELAAIVDALGIRRFFHRVITSGLIGYEKPHDRIFEAATEHSVPGAPIWMIGDNLACDCAPVGAFGAEAILVRSESPDFRCAEDLKQAVNFLQSR